jgi:hypothetical protein
LSQLELASQAEISTRHLSFVETGRSRPTLAQWRTHLLGQVRRRAAQTGDPRLAELLDELRGYPGGEDTTLPALNVVLPLRLAHRVGELSFFSIAATVETAADVTVDELAIESFYPADAETAERLRELA